METKSNFYVGFPFWFFDCVKNYTNIHGLATTKNQSFRETSLFSKISLSKRNYKLPEHTDRKLIEPLLKIDDRLIEAVIKMEPLGKRGKFLRKLKPRDHVDLLIASINRSNN